MTEVETAKMSERGQVIIPKGVRDYIGAKENTIFTVMPLDKETIVMKKLDKMKLIQEFKSIRKTTEKLTPEEINKEIKDVLARPRIKLNLVEQKFVLNNFEKFSKKISTSSKFDIIKDDPADNKFLECAVDSKADYIISGDNHLLKLKEFKGIKIITPAEFVKTHKND